MTPLRYIRRAWKLLIKDLWVPCSVIPFANAWKAYNPHTGESQWKHRLSTEDYYFDYEEAIARCRELNKG